MDTHEQLGTQIGHLLRHHHAKHHPTPDPDVAVRLRFARSQAVQTAAMQLRAPLTATVAQAVSVGFSAVAASASASNRPKKANLENNDVNGAYGLWVAAVLFTLLLGLMGIGKLQEQEQLNDLAAMDTVLLLDAVPASAYADPGFVRFMALSRHPGDTSITGNAGNPRNAGHFVSTTTQ